MNTTLTTSNNSRKIELMQELTALISGRQPLDMTGLSPSELQREATLKEVEKSLLQGLLKNLLMPEHQLVSGELARLKMLLNPTGPILQ